MVDHEVDFGLATLPLLHPQVTSEVLFTREDVMICPPGCPLARESVVSLAQVSPYPLLALSRGSTSRQLLEAAFQQAGVPMQVAMNLGSIEVVKRFVAIGLGLAIVPRVAVADEARAVRWSLSPSMGCPSVRLAWSNALGNVAPLLRPPFSSSCVRILHAIPLESAEACVDEYMVSSDELRLIFALITNRGHQPILLGYACLGGIT